MEDKYKDIFNEARKGNGGKLDLNEFLTRSEGPELFTTVINQKLMDGLSEFPSTVGTLFDSVPATNRTTRFPSIRGVNPDLVKELGEFPLLDTEITSINVEVQKFGLRLGFSQEMIDDNEVGLIGRRATEIGRAHREMRDREMVKSISFFSTGPAVSTGVIGLRDKGPRYAQGGYTNVVSGTALTWEERIARCIDILWQQTITVQDMTIQFPVRPNFILLNPSHQVAVQKVLNASITVVASGVGPNTDAIGGGTNLAGTNIMQGAIPQQVYHPSVHTGQAFIGLAKRGLVMLTKDPLTTESKRAFAFDATELKSRERFIPAVVEERFICDLQISGG